MKAQKSEVHKKYLRFSHYKQNIKLWTGVVSDLVIEQNKTLMSSIKKSLGWLLANQRKWHICLSTIGLLSLLLFIIYIIIVT